MAATRLFAVLIVLITASSARPAIQLISSSPTSLGQGLVQYTLSAVSNDGTIINGVSNPIIVPNAGSMGLHQVWTPITSAPTPTRMEQQAAGLLWSDTWRPYDSYFFFASENSISLGLSFSETNSMSGGAALPSAGLGSPETGFGSYGFHGSTASKTYTIASGIPDTNVPLAQLVMRESDVAIVSLNVLDQSGGSTPFDSFVVGCLDCGPSVGNLNLGDIVRGGMISATLPLHPFASIDPDSWTLDSFTGPHGSSVAGAAVDPSTGAFSWNSFQQSLGPYSAAIGATEGGFPVSGTLTFNLVIPEPSSAMLLALAALAALGCSGRR